MYGSNIASASDKLVKFEEKYLHSSLIHPKESIARSVEQLRVIYSVDGGKYSYLKKKLPYFVCGLFNPPYRNSANFAYTDSFILDFDHLSAKNLDIDSVRSKIQADERVVMCFCSPSEDGLKVLFHLKSPCYDKGIYSLFYKAFASSFATMVGLEQVIDSHTSDVARACFVSMDLKAYYNPDAAPVDIGLFVDPSNPLAMADLRRQQNDLAGAEPEEGQKGPREPDDEVMAKIRKKLNPTAKAAPEKNVTVPAKLRAVIAPLRDFLEDKGIVVNNIRDIQYGQQIEATIGTKSATLNLFFGKKGFTPIPSPKNGTDTQANELLQLAVNNFLSNNDL